PRANRLGAIDRQLRRLPARVVATRVGVADEVEAVVAVQVRDEHRVDVEEVADPAEVAERTVPEVDEQPETVLLDEVGRARRVRTGEGAGASDDREVHASCSARPASWLTEPTSGPRKRRPKVSKGVGSPVARNWWAGTVPGAHIRPWPASTR